MEILTLLLETPTDDSVEVAVGFLKECGQKLTEVTPRGVTGKNPQGTRRNIAIFLENLVFLFFVALCIA